MKRPTRDDRTLAIAEAALQTFSEKGYRLTQVADVAKQAGVAAGTIYLFAKSKEDLFRLALKLAAGRSLDATETKMITATELRAEFMSEGGALANRRLTNDGGELPTLESVVRSHWDVVSHAARAIKLVERCAQDWPELAEAFYGDLRVSVIQDLAGYLREGAEAGLCRKVQSPELAARFIVESIAWFAMHRLGDVDGRFIDADEAREATVDALIHAFGVPEVVEENR